MEIALVRAGDRYRNEVTRDDGAVVRIPGVGRADPLPHDLVHYVIESELGLDYGFWGETARGRIFGPVEFLQRPTGRPKRGARRRGGKGVSAESLVHVVMGVWRGDAESYGSLGAYLRTVMSPAAMQRAGIDPSSMRRIRFRLGDLADEWKRVPDGGRLVLTWPLPQQRRAARRELAHA